MYPMDFEEFLWAIDDEIYGRTVKSFFFKKKEQEMRCIEI